MTPHNPLPPLEAMNEEELKELIALADKQIEAKEAEKVDAFHKKAKIVKDAIWELLKDYPTACVDFGYGDDNKFFLEDLIDDNAEWNYC